MSNKNISIIGVGRLGLCVGLCLEHAGYNVLGVDVIPDYVEKINNKTERDVLSLPDNEIYNISRLFKELRKSKDIKISRFRSLSSMRNASTKKRV